MKKCTTYFVPAYTLNDLIASLGEVFETHGDGNIESIALRSGFDHARSRHTLTAEVTVWGGGHQ